MENSPELSALFVILLLASAITGECFPSSEEQVNSTVPWPRSEIPPQFLPIENSVLSYTTGYTWSPGDGNNYVGLEALLDVYGFSLQPGQQSSAVIWIVNKGDGQPSSFSGVQVGWHIDPSLYKDSRTHFYVAWTNGGQCQDTVCPGFQKTSTSIGPGDVINPVSSFHGHKVYITLRVFKEKSSGDWHIHYGVNGDPKPVGYFPKYLVSGLIDKPVEITFGGYVSHKKPQPSPPMGSGDVPSSGYAASFNGLKLIDANGNDHLVQTNLRHHADPRDCYPITNLANAQFCYGGSSCAD